MGWGTFESPTPVLLTSEYIMDFPVSRHLQRYEYVQQKGYVTNRKVIDLGCGDGSSMSILAMNATKVLGVDKKMPPKEWTFTSFCGSDRLSKCMFYNIDIFDLETYEIPFRIDVATAIEVFEHIPNPNRLINLVAKLAENLFITTPLVDVTGKTRNPDHVVEYSAKDFEDIVSKRFDIIDKVYQLSDMSIVNEAIPNGDSIDPSHVVQMLWCKRKKEN